MRADAELVGRHLVGSPHGVVPRLRLARLWIAPT